VAGWEKITHEEAGGDNSLDSHRRGNDEKKSNKLLIEIFAPLVPLAEIVIGDDEDGAAGGGSRRAYKLHIGFFGGFTGLAPVTGHTGTDHVFPGMLAAAIARYYVVEGKVATPLAAVLAGVLIAIKYLVAGHLSLAAGPSYQLGEADDGGKLDGIIDGVNVAEAVLDHLRFALVNQDNGPAGAADRKRFVALVEHQYGMVNYHRLALKLNCPYITTKFTSVQGEAELN
jgi:hypothetical protein